MEFKILIYIIGIIIYFFYSANKSAKKGRELKSKNRPETKTKTWEEELQEILQTKASDLGMKNTRHFNEAEEEEEVEETFVESRYVPESEVYEKERQQAWQEHIKEEKYSVEVDESSLQEHIDEMQKHFGLPEEGKNENESHEIMQDFDARKAFIYSEIFHPKYQD
ncbi:MAG: hypothetical protein LPK45_06460 [Bacteroidota bacterium]|nr:hypothetical protein [Bacteroidota bacterium]MDX5430715.1 hypothetical protein [Bacteroidota bacterium]MDX5469462.1 hypothetical protein [Bacteroidota bacterium]